MENYHLHNLNVIHIDTNKPCPQCGNLGAVIRDGFTYICFSCAEEHLRAGNTKKLKHLPDYWVCEDDISTLGAMLIRDHHPEASNAKICYVWRKKHIKVNGKIKLGSCQRVSAKDRLLHGFDYVILLSWDMWTIMDDQQQREALLLHEILHIFKDEGEDGNPAWKIEPHNVEEFSKVIDVYGLWKPDLAAFAESIYRKRDEHEGHQMSFPDFMKKHDLDAQATAH